MNKTKLGIVGFGKIARDQHAPTINASQAFELAAIASRNASTEGVRCFPSLRAMLDNAPDIEAVVLCTPPAARHADARLAIEAGRHVLLEKPPGVTVSEVEDLRQRALGAGVALHASWHSRHAAGVNLARSWLKNRTILRGAIVWREDIRKWHPGQDWILDNGGLGVFDPGVNAFSIATEVLPLPLFVRDAKLQIPVNREAPIAAQLSLQHGEALIDVDMHFLEAANPVWSLHFETDRGDLQLSRGGDELSICGRCELTGESDDHAEYKGVYEAFAACLKERRVSVDSRPLQLVADAFLVGERAATAAFAFEQDAGAISHTRI